MNRCTFMLVCIGFCVLTCLPFPRESQAVESLSIGITSYYSWWNPAWRSQAPGSDGIRGLLYGPALSLGINGKWSISAIYLTCAEKTGYSYDTRYQDLGTAIFLPTCNVIIWDRQYGKMIRHDGDFVVNYGLNKYLKLFGGVKINFIQSLARSDLWLYRNFSPQGFMPFFKSKEVANYYNSYGAGLGLATNLRLVDNLYFIANVSFLYLYSTSRFGVSQPSWYHVVGCNTTASFSYNIAPANISLVAGGRFQYLKYFIATNNSNILGSGKLNDDSYYGVTFSVIYSFNLRRSDGGNG